MDPVWSGGCGVTVIHVTLTTEQRFPVEPGHIAQRRDRAREPGHSM